MHVITVVDLDAAGDPVPGSLRDAILKANAMPGPDDIFFGLMDGTTISPTVPLPPITDTVTIDALTAFPGFPGPLTTVELKGGGAGPGANGLLLSASGSTIRGLVINDFSGFGIRVTGSGNTIVANKIGTDPSGLMSVPNMSGGIHVTGSGNTIGGVTDVARNLISGNGGDGVRLDGSATGNLVRGNNIGTNLPGTAVLGNAGNGVQVMGVAGNSVGGAAAGAGNVIAGNMLNGVLIAGSAASGNHVDGNRIGTNKDGTAALPNLLDGVRILEAPGNDVGGAAAGAGNQISGNGKVGVRVAGTMATLNTIQGNTIGLHADGTSALGNLEHGVLVEGMASSTTIGGPAMGEGNTVAFNGMALARHGHGVVIVSGTKNAIRRNLIFDNFGRGIDLGNGVAPDGFTVNDPGDSDMGPNELQDYPVVLSRPVGADTSAATWRLNSKPSTTYVLEFFGNDAADPSGFGEGKRYLGDATVTTNTKGDVTIPKSFAGESLISATATDPLGNTSEFSMIDSDADGLADAWETTGLDVDEDGTADLMLTGASALHKDLFVEVDALSDRVPVQAVLDDVIAAFAAAPDALVHNPDGAAGVTLHAFLSDTDIPSSDFPSHWDEFDAIKAARFGSPAQRMSLDWPKILGALKVTHRYGLFARRYAGTNSSGLAELPGNDFMVTLSAGASKDDKAGTLMHELGHTLDLHHGGGDDVNFKPNYPSVMNYTWQFPDALHRLGAGVADYTSSWVLDYSRSALPTLDERSLSETAGIGGRPGKMVPVGVSPPLGLVPELGPVDWDGDGTFSGSEQRDINFDGKSSGMLFGHDDWSNLLYYFLEGPNTTDGEHPESEENEISLSPVDFGDAPDTPYPTLLHSDGARHTTVTGFHLGTSVDAEPEGLQSADALGDDTIDMSDDEDGVTFVTALRLGETATVEVVASAVGKLDAWVDFNDDGDWADAGEQIFASRSLVASTNSLTFPVPGTATLTSETFARFRFSSAGGLSYDGPALDGEVEDYAVAILGSAAGPALLGVDIDDGTDAASGNVNVPGGQNASVRRITLSFGSTVGIALGTTTGLSNSAISTGGGLILQVLRSDGLGFEVKVHHSVDGLGRSTLVLTFAGGSGASKVVGGSLADGHYELKFLSGVAGPPAPVTFDRLFGDGDGSGAVDDKDLALFRRAMRSRRGSPTYSAYFDFDGDGDVDSADYAHFMRRYRTRS